MTLIRSLAVGTVALFMVASLASVGHADSKATVATTQPVVRTIAVYGSASASYTLNNDATKRQALSTAADAALADAKQKAERSAKILGVTLGPPITVGLPTEDAPPAFDNGVRSATLTVYVDITFELVP